MSLRYLGILLFLSVFYSCGQRQLDVTHEYLTHKVLASYVTHTPDPRSNTPFEGERLIIEWNIPDKIFKERQWNLCLFVHFYNRTEETFKIPVQEYKGNYIFQIINDEYNDRQGILTYRVEIKSGDIVLDSFVHHLWAKLIKVTDA